MTAPAPFEYNPGDLVRVLVDEPYSTELRTGDIARVVEQALKVDGAIETPVVIVETALGRRFLGLDVIEPFTPDYAPAEPDEIIDARLTALLSADPELLTWVTDAETALGAEDGKLSDQLATEEAAKNAANWTDPAPSDVMTITDFAGDELRVIYSERVCPTHGRESAFFFEINGDENVMLPARFADPLIRFLFLHRKHADRPEEGGTVAA